MAFFEFRCFLIQLFIGAVFAEYQEKDEKSTEKEKEEEAARDHEVNSALFLLLFALLILTVLTTWLVKVKRFRFLHETGLSVIYGNVTSFRPCLLCSIIIIYIILHVSSLHN